MNSFSIESILSSTNKTIRKRPSTTNSRHFFQSVSKLRRDLSPQPSTSQIGSGPKIKRDPENPSTAIFKNRAAPFLPQQIDENAYRRVDNEFVNNKKFNFTKSRSKFIIKLKDDVDYENILLEIIQKALIEAEEYAKKLSYTPYSRSIAIVSENLNEPLYLSFRKPEDLTAENAVAAFSKLQQSASTANLLAKPFYLEINNACNIIGKRGLNKKAKYVKETGLFDNFSPDDRCLFRAVAVLLSKIKYNSAKIARGIARQTSREAEYIDIYEDILKHFKINKKLNEKNEYPLSFFGPLLEEFLNTSEKWKSYGKFRLIVVSSRTIGDLWLYPSIEDEYKFQPKNNIILYFNNSHYQSVWTPSKFFGSKYFCLDCRKTTASLVQHSVNCKSKCSFCSRKVYQPPCKPDSQPIKCPDCHIVFHNSSCYDNHKGATCNRFTKCECCGEKHRRSRFHRCGWRLCEKCKVIHPPRACHMTPIKPPKSSPIHKIVCFDFETTQQNIGNDTLKHVVNFANCQVLCQVCLDFDELPTEPCPNCQSLNKTWSIPHGDPHPEAQFLNFLKNITPKGSTTTATAHFGGRFDLQLMLDEIFKQNAGQNVQMVTTGNKIFVLIINGSPTFGKIKFIDNFNYMPMGLDKLPKALSLPDCVNMKGFFSHEFNKPCNYEYNQAPYPPITSYYADSFMPAKRAEFDLWYQENGHKNYNFKEELMKYGKNDVKILSYAVHRYRKLVRLIADDPFEDVFYTCATLASATLRILRMKFLKENQIAIIPTNGYTRNENQSLLALNYLKWVEQEEALTLRHKDHIDGEFTILIPRSGLSPLKYKIDGYDENTKTIIEVNGCRWHGHISCYKDSFDVQGPLLKTPRELYEAYNLKVKNLQDAGYTVRTVWECSIRKSLAENSKMREFFETQIDKSPIQIADSFFGGRCQNFCFNSEAVGGKNLLYSDIQSLYPSVLYEDLMPISHPEHVKMYEEVNWTRPDQLPDKKAILKVKITPPSDLYAPVIPYRFNKMLIFMLCKTCTRKHAGKDALWRDLKCQHSDSERSFVTTATSVELALALEKGYKINYVFDYYIWAESSNEIFSDYIKALLKIKLESSGPADDLTDRDGYLKEVKDRYGFDLDISKWMKNEGLRTISKLFLNSLWGKLGQRNNLVKLKICKNGKELAQILSHPANIVNKIDFVGEFAYIRYHEKDEYIRESDFSNIAIAAFTTSYARCRLYKFIDEAIKNGAKPLYIDTDSIIVEYEGERFPITIGNFLGMMERERVNQRIVKFVSGGSKQYALEIEDLITKKVSHDVKIRGFTLNSATTSILNFNSFNTMVREKIEFLNPSVSIPYTMLRPNITGGVLTKNINKIYKPVCSKAWLDSKDNRTLFPFGYKVN